jgi:hypothetical protein
VAGELGLLEVLPAVLALEPHHRFVLHGSFWRQEALLADEIGRLARVLAGRSNKVDVYLVREDRQPTIVHRANMAAAITTAHIFFFRKGPFGRIDKHDFIYIYLFCLDF